MAGGLWDPHVLVGSKGGLPRKGSRSVGGVSPSKHMVEKKAMLRVSKGESWVHSGDRVWGSDSPVNDELSTWRRW